MVSWIFIYNTVFYIRWDFPVIDPMIEVALQNLYCMIFILRPNMSIPA